MTNIAQYFSEVLFKLEPALNKTFKAGSNLRVRGRIPKGVIIQMTGIEHFFPVVLFVVLHGVVLPTESFDKI